MSGIVFTVDLEKTLFDAFVSLLRLSEVRFQQTEKPSQCKRGMLALTADPVQQVQGVVACFPVHHVKAQ